MAKQQRKTGLFCVKLGYGRNNAYMANGVHSASQVLKYDTADEAALKLESLIIPEALTGAFDDGLKETLEAHKERSVVRNQRRTERAQLEQDETDQGSA